MSRHAATPPSEGRRGLASTTLHGARTALVATLCCVVAPHLGIREPYWSAISCIIVMQTEVTASVAASRDRLVGTVIGGLLGWGCAVVWDGDMLVYALAVALALAVCGALGLAAAGRISGVTVSIIVLLPLHGPAWLLSLHRLLGVAFGVVVGLGAALGSARFGIWWEARRLARAGTGSGSGA
jgi:uncharacterized membrane protein YgaE (UPF0421/DUF939 family)